jgi:hypothetical protein
MADLGKLTARRVEMSIPVIAFSAGLLLIVISVFGGGIEVKEVKIPNLGMVPRILTFLLGSSLLAVCVLKQDLLSQLQRSGEDEPIKQGDNSATSGGKSLPGASNSSVESSYKFFNSQEVGAIVEFPMNILSVDTTERLQRRLSFRDGEGRVRVRITRTALPDSKDIKLERTKEKGELESHGYVMTYVAPKLDSNWKNWYVLSGLGNNTIIYIRRWYLDDSVGSLEFTFPKELSSLYEPIITTMAHDLIFSETMPKLVP